MAEIILETGDGVQDKVDEHDTDGAAHADIRALISGGVPDATSGAKGKIQLAGDLGGTAASPTVPGLTAKADASATTSALAAKAADSAVVHNTGAETVAGIKTFSSSPIVPTPTTGTQAANKAYADSLVAGGAPDATTGSKGIVQLAGDLGGTAVSPTVPGLAAKAADSAVVHNTGAETVAGVKTFSSAPVVPSAAFPESAVTNLVSDLAAKATDSAVVHNTGAETVAGVKTFSSAPVVPSASFPESAVTNLTSDLAAKATDSAVVHNTGTETVAGVKTFSSSPIVPTPTTGTQAVNKTYADGLVAGGAPDATTGSKGIVQLAGDLGGTAASPTVPGLAGKAATSHTHAESDVTSLVADLAAKAPVLIPTAVKTSAYTAAAGDFVPVDTTSGAVTITLPTTPADKTQVGVKHVIVGSTNVVTYACGGSDVINRAGGSTSGSLTLTAQAVWLQYKSSTGIWYVLADDVPLSQLDTRYTTTERAAVRTLTNARITKRVGTTASSSTPTADADSHDGYTVTAAALNMTIGAPTGTPTSMQMILYRFLDNGTARTIAWNAVFRAVGVTLPTTTVISKTLYVLTIWNEAASKWDAISTGVEA